MQLYFTKEMHERLQGALGKHGLILAQRSLSNDMTLFRTPKSGIKRVMMHSPQKAIFNLSPEESVLLGMALILYSGPNCPDFCKETFDLEFEEDESQVEEASHEDHPKP